MHNPSTRLRGGPTPPREEWQEAGKVAIELERIRVLLARADSELSEARRERWEAEEERTALRREMNSVILRLTSLHKTRPRAGIPPGQVRFDPEEVLHVGDCVRILASAPSGCCLVVRRAKQLELRGSFLVERHLLLKYGVKVAWIKQAASRKRHVLMHNNGILAPCEAIFIILHSKEMVDRVLAPFGGQDGFDTLFDPWTLAEHRLLFTRYDKREEDSVISDCVSEVDQEVFWNPPQLRGVKRLYK